MRYPWPGNVRQLKNIAEQISAIETERTVDADRLLDYLPELPRRSLTTLPVDEADAGPGMNEREILYKLLFEMKSDLSDLKSLVLKMIQDGRIDTASSEDHALVNRVFGEQEDPRSCACPNGPDALPRSSRLQADGPPRPRAMDLPRRARWRRRCRSWRASAS